MAKSCNLITSYWALLVLSDGGGLNMHPGAIFIKVMAFPAGERKGLLRLRLWQRRTGAIFDLGLPKLEVGVHAEAGEGHEAAQREP